MGVRQNPPEPMWEGKVLVSSMGVDWKFSQDGSDHESSVDFVMSEHSEESFSSESQ